MSNAAAKSLKDRTDQLIAERGNSVGVSEVVDIVSSLIEGKSYGDDIEAIAIELREMLDYVGSAKYELDKMQAKSLSNRDIPDATNQLDAIVQATEDAASVIMDAAEVISEIAENVDQKQGEKLMDLSTHLFEASSFQDLTGQRITKVEKILNHLEDRLNNLADAIGDTYVAPPEDQNIAKDAEGVAMNDTDLLHGPQLEGQGNSQEDIDALLASFD